MNDAAKTDTATDAAAMSEAAMRDAAMMCAALDLGTSNCRLLIARPRDDNFEVVDSFSRIVRLGERLEATGRLGEPAMRRTIDALRVCAEKMARRQVTHIRAVATEACRRADNGAAFVARVAAETGIAFDIITAEAEAGLAAKSCAGLIDVADRRGGIDHGLLFDIGGGSTQVILVRLDARDPDGFEILASHSIPWGVVTLSEYQVKTGCDTAAARHMVRETLAPIERGLDVARLIVARRIAMVGTSGTVTTLAAVHLGLARYDRRRIDGLALMSADLAAAGRRLAALDIAARARIACVGPQRADLVVAGSTILEALLATWPVGHLRVADRGLREGLLLDLMRAAAPAVRSA